MKEPIWRPSAERVHHSNMSAFLRFAEHILKKPINSYSELYNWSVSDIEEFWKSIWITAGVIHSKKYNSILSGEQMFDSKWFDGAELNFAENLLKYRDHHTAIISSREDKPAIRISYQELYRYVASFAEGLKKSGVKKGDRVAGFISNIPEAIIGMLASASIGAIWSSASPDFGLQGILDRFSQIKPKILLAVESYQYNGRIIDCRERIEKIKENIPEIEKVIVVSQFYDFSSIEKKSEIKNSIRFSELIGIKSGDIEFEQVPFDHPVYIMYSSGTTGIPKCIVHGGGGTLLQHFKELSLHTNLTRHDIITYYTTCGWMMWNWLVSSLNIGATIFLYDGSPVYPNINILWRKIEEEKITIFGTSPKFLSICQKSNFVPKEKFSLSELKTILSTGSPLSEENFKYVYSNVKDDIQLSSISGGTDIISCFMLGNPVLPVYPGELQCRGLGMKVEAFNEKGESVIEEKGELVCTKTFPSMPVYFWNDPEKIKYKSAYFEYFNGVWRHGDFIKITENGGVIIYGRSDATLNPGGIRIGTAEIYRSVEAMDEITDSIVVGQNYKNDIRIILFVVVKDEFVLSKELIDKIKERIRSSATPRHVPAKILQIKEVPRTISGKKVEIAVTRIINDEKVENKDALINPDSLNQFIGLEELE
ncbi:MAG: acetoacetate--CoA ligase [Ignavibacteriaceae bacterium]